MIVITAGDDWKICADEKFVLDADNFKLYDYAGSKGFDVCQPLLEREMVYGFGERFDAVNQRGRVLSLWHRDAFEGCNCSIEISPTKMYHFYTLQKVTLCLLTVFTELEQILEESVKGFESQQQDPKQIFMFLREAS